MLVRNDSPSSFFIAENRPGPRMSVGMITGGTEPLLRLRYSDSSVSVVCSSAETMSASGWLPMTRLTVLW